MESTRIDKWLVAVRVYKTRAVAAQACDGGKVRLNGRAAKPSAAVRVGDRIEARVGERVRELEVVKVIDKRVGAQPAAECLIDHSPPPEPRRREFEPRVAERDSGAGRPTKRDRRQMQKFRGR